MKNKKYVILRSFSLTDYVILRSFDLKKAFYKYFCQVLSSATPHSGISSVVDGFHLALHDFICRKANFVARTSLYAPVWAVGVAALWGYYINSGVGNDNISATCNSATATHNYRRTEPFRGIGTRACTSRETVYIQCRHFKRYLAMT